MESPAIIVNGSMQEFARKKGLQDVSKRELNRLS